MKKPFFSVLMPTYNRAELLPLAIKSVLGQTVEDFELVVSNGGSTDNTREVVAGFTDARIRYIESEEKLSIGDNYNRALDNARGEFITFLGDDDAFVPTMFERVKKIIDEEKAQVVGFRFCNYYHDVYVESYDRQIPANTLQIPQFAGGVNEFSAAEAIENLYNESGLNDAPKNAKFVAPYLANAVYHNEVFARVRRVNGNPFDTTPADMYMATAVFFVIDSYFCIDAPLHVWSRWTGSSTAMAHEKGNALRKHYEKLLGGKTLRFTPLKFALPHNCAVNAVMQAASDFEPAANDAVDWLRYYVTVYENLMFLKSLNVDISRELDEFRDGLAKESPALKKSVAAEIGKPALRAKLFLRDNFPLALEIGKKIFRRKNPNEPQMINGGERDFKNVLQAAVFLDGELL